MIKILNTILSYLKVLLLLVTFVFSFFIIINMYQRLEKNMINAIFNFIPFILLFILFAINIIFKQKSVNNCLFYNVTCCLVFLMLLFSVYRTFCDKNMIAIIRLGYNINFNYFADVIAPMKAMLYILSVSLSYSSYISPTISSKISSIVTIPAVPPYSSKTIAICFLLFLNS